MAVTVLVGLSQPDFDVDNSIVDERHLLNLSTSLRVILLVDTESIYPEKPRLVWGNLRAKLAQRMFQILLVEIVWWVRCARILIEAVGFTGPQV
jgi:hypothetical protein